MFSGEKGQVDFQGRLLGVETARCKSASAIPGVRGFSLCETIPSTRALKGGNPLEEDDNLSSAQPSRLDRLDALPRSSATMCENINSLPFQRISSLEERELFAA